MTKYILKPDNNVLANLLHHLSELDPFKEWQVEIKPHKKNKTAQQRNYYHKLLQILSDYSGDTIEDLKTRMCWTLGYTREVVLKTGEIIIERQSTEKLGVQEYSTMIEAAQMACMTLELSYPQPSHYGLDI